MLLAGRIPRRRGKPHRPSRHHDPRLHGAGSAPRRWHRRQPAAPVGRHRGRPRSGDRPRSGAGSGRGRQTEAGARMSAVVALRERADVRHAPHAHAAPSIAVALVGTGLVGRAVLRRLALDGSALSLVGVANSRRSLIDAAGLPVDSVVERLSGEGATADVEQHVEPLLRSPAQVPVLIDATPSEDIARRHADWLAAGVNVVSANKLALGTTRERWQALRAGAQAGATRYGDAATVGAGLPALATLRRLRRCGDPVLRNEGVFSGSLSFLYNRLG